MITKWMLVLLVIAAGALIAGGCGSDDGENPSGADTGSNGSAQSSDEGNGDVDGGSNAVGSESEADTGEDAVEADPGAEVFIKEANAICKRLRTGLIRELGAYFKRHDLEGKSESKIYARLIRDVRLPVMESENAQLSELQPSPGDEAEIESILAAQREAIENVKQIDAIESQKELEDQFAEVDTRIRAYGFDACANGSA